MKKRIFFNGPKSKENQKNIVPNDYAAHALKLLAERSGDSIQDIICDALEDYLVMLANAGEIPFPDEKVAKSLRKKSS